MITKGKWEDIGGVDSYVATPAGDYSKDKVVLYLPDAFGAQLLNAQVGSFIKLRSSLLSKVNGSSDISSFWLMVLLLMDSRLATSFFDYVKSI